MPHELEAKFPIDDFRAIRRALKAAGAEYHGTAEQEDTFFDSPERHLYNADRGLRLRRIRVLRGANDGFKSGWLLTYKGARQKHDRIKLRRELQTHVDDGEALIQLLQAAGMEIHMHVTKRRSSYKLGRCWVELDELEGLGKFVEIEAPTEARLEAVREQIGLNVEPIMDSYPHMVEQQRKKK